MKEEISFKVTMNEGYEPSLNKLSEALKAEGFGILTQIDVQKTFKEKIDVDFQKFSILGVCNPKLAYRALSHNSEAGLMLPCNVTLESDTDQKTVIRIIDPVKMLDLGHMGEDDVLGQVGEEAREKLLRVVDSLISTNHSNSKLI